jgi:hypothetical protein
VDTEWLLSTLFDASLLSLEPPATAALFLFARFGIKISSQTDAFRPVLCAKTAQELGSRDRLETIADGFGSGGWTEPPVGVMLCSL